MEIRHLRQVCAIHRLGSFAKASGALGISQPTLSKSMARLEDELGFELFHRGAGGAAATPLGLHVVARAERILADTALLNREVTLMSAGERGRVTVGAGSVLASAFLPQFARALVDAYPRLEARLIVETRAGLMEGLRTGGYDMVLVVHSEDLDTGEFHVVPLGSEPTVGVAAPGHPLALEPEVTLEMLLRHPLATSSATHPFDLHHVLQVAPGEPPTGPLYVSNDFAVLKALALAGAAVALGPRHNYQTECLSGDLVVIGASIRFELKLSAVMNHAALHWPVLPRLARIASDMLVEDFALQPPP